MLASSVFCQGSDFKVNIEVIAASCVWLPGMDYFIIVGRAIVLAGTEKWVGHGARP